LAPGVSKEEAGSNNWHLHSAFARLKGGGPDGAAAAHLKSLPAVLHEAAALAAAAVAAAGDDDETARKWLQNTFTKNFTKKFTKSAFDRLKEQTELLLADKTVSKTAQTEGVGGCGVGVGVGGGGGVGVGGAGGGLPRSPASVTAAQAALVQAYAAAFRSSRRRRSPSVASDGSGGVDDMVTAPAASAVSAASVAAAAAASTTALLRFVASSPLRGPHGSARVRMECDSADGLLQLLLPTRESERQRTLVVKYFRSLVQDLIVPPDKHGIRVMSTGSHALKTYLPSSDVDIVVMCQELVPDEVPEGPGFIAPKNPKLKFKGQLLPLEPASLLRINQQLCREAMYPGELAKVQGVAVRSTTLVAAKLPLAMAVLNNISVDVCLNASEAAASVAYFAEADKVCRRPAAVSLLSQAS
jgi:hypothetical protein